MPEGHTIHRLARDHRKWFAGQKVHLLSPQGRFADEATQLSGNKLKEVDAKGKHLFYHWTRDRFVHVHLGLYGKFRIHKNPPPEPRGAVRLRLIGERQAFDLNGPNCCELIGQEERQKILDRLGEDPLRDDADPTRAWNRVQKSRAAIGGLLLNQSVIAGVGNVYRAEILFLAGVHPARQGRELSPAEFDTIWDLTVRLLKIGVKYNRIITVDRATSGKPLSRLNRSERLYCYKRPKCRDCGHPIRKWELANRTMYACEHCQT